MELEYELTPADYQIAKSNGITYKRAYERFYSLGWSKKDSITRPLGRVTLWPEYKDLCEQNGIKQRCFYKRIESGMTPHQAATLSPNRKNQLYKDSKITQEMIEQAKANGINEYTFKHRVYQYRWSVEKAMNTPVDTNKRKKTLMAQ